jgi:aldose 1-epimerase
LKLKKERAAMEVHWLENAHGNSVTFVDLGGCITSIEVPDRHGVRRNVVLAYQEPAAYEHQTLYFGCIVGRYANRIANARFTLDGREWLLRATDGTSHVHGGGGVSTRRFGGSAASPRNRQV